MSKYWDQTLSELGVNIPLELNEEMVLRFVSIVDEDESKIKETQQQIKKKKLMIQKNQSMSSGW